MQIESRLASGGALSGGRRRKIMFSETPLYTDGIQDDHIHFEKKSVPILHLITYPFPKVWHKMSDNRNAVDFNSVSDLNKIFRVFVAEYLGLEP